MRKMSNAMFNWLDVSKKPHQMKQNTAMVTLILEAGEAQEVNDGAHRQVSRASSYEHQRQVQMMNPPHSCLRSADFRLQEGHSF